VHSWILPSDGDREVPHVLDPPVNRWNVGTESADLLREQAYLIERGVRPLAATGTCGDRTPDSVVQELHGGAAGARVIPFALPGGICGYASHAWVVDLVRWADSGPRVQRDRILGLLLGYKPDAIRQFEELGSTLGPFDQE